MVTLERKVTRLRGMLRYGIRNGITRSWRVKLTDEEELDHKGATVSP